jgi:hypothetical protein
LIELVRERAHSNRDRHALDADDRLVHHATILEINVESYRRRAALDRKDRHAMLSPVPGCGFPRSFR